MQNKLAQDGDSGKLDISFKNSGINAGVMYFMNNQFVQSALKKVASPEILVNVVSKRVRQLGQGFRPLVEAHPRWTFMDIALREIAEGKIIYELTEEPKAAPVKKSKKSAKD